MEAFQRLTRKASPVVRLLLGALFIYAGVAKVIDVQAFAAQIQQFGIGYLPVAGVIAHYLPFLEIACGLSFVVRRFMFGATMIYLVLLMGFEVGLGYAWATGYEGSCGCFGNFFGGASVQGAFVRNLVLLALVGVVAWREVLRNQKRWDFRGGAVLGTSVATLMLVAVGENAAEAIEVHPTSLTFETKVNQPVVLKLEVTGIDALGDIDLRAEGLLIQRQSAAPSPNRRQFLIEPETSVSGRVAGIIAIVDRDGATLASVPVNGDVQPWVKISPPRVFLGSLEYGTTSEHTFEKSFRLSATSDFRILDVDVSEIPHASYRVEDLQSGAKELHLRLDADALKDGEPFGAFITRTVRIKTDHPEQREVSIPITAMLSRNGTARDFNTFLFAGNERWQGKWTTPNIAAAVIGPLILLALGWGAWLVGLDRRSPRLIPRSGANRTAGRFMSPLRILQWTVGLSFIAGALVGMVFLIKTYSRGGWVAFGVGLACLILLMKGRRRILALGGAVFLTIIAILPAGMTRAASAGAVSGDLSIRNRLLVWGGALEMIAEHPQGVGAGQFGDIFSKYYQEPWHKADYSTALNDALTFAAERGLWPVLAALGAVGFLVGLTVHLVERHRNWWIAPLVAALGGVFVSSTFSSIEFVREVRTITFAMTGVLLAYCVGRGCLEARTSRAARSGMLPGLYRAILAAVFICGGFGGAVVLANANRTVSPVRSVFNDASNVPLETLEYMPGTASSRGIVLFISEKAQPMENTGRQFLRPLAQQGWRAIALQLPPYDQEASLAVKRFADTFSEPLIIVAEGPKARVAMGAWVAASPTHRPRLALIESKLYSALPECDQSSAVKGASVPVVSIDAETWNDFKRESRTEATSLSERLATLVNDHQPASSEHRFVGHVLSDPQAVAVQ